MIIYHFSRTVLTTPVASIARIVTKDFTGIQMRAMVVELVHVQRPIKSLHAAATSIGKVSRAFAKKATLDRSVKSAPKAILVSHKNPMESARAATATLRELCQTSVITSMASATASRV
jgi:hypothetical protein